jgi:hypothetical protein
MGTEFLSHTPVRQDILERKGLSSLARNLIASPLVSLMKEKTTHTCTIKTSSIMVMLMGSRRS